MEEKKSIFQTLNEINVNDKVEKKNNLSYLSWAWAWGEVKKKYPNAQYKIYERESEFGPINYFTDGRTAWVKTSVIINELEHIEELPVMDFKNKSITLDKLTSFDVNKAIQRSLTKAIARHGLGLYIYAGEDLPEEEKIEQQKKEKEQAVEKKLEEIKMRCFKAQNALQKLGIDTHSEEFCEHLKAEYKITSQDIPNLNGNGLVALIKAYGAIYKENAKA